MVNEPCVFLETSVLFAAVLSETGGARLILKLGEAGVLRLRVGPRVLREADNVLARKAPKSKALFALLLDQAGVELGPAPDAILLDRAERVVDYAPDARVLAEALATQTDYFVTFDRQHFIDNPSVSGLPFPVGTPGEFLAWLRERLRRFESGE
jgi:predicted nucleic acid-binding protein